MLQNVPVLAPLRCMGVHVCKCMTGSRLGNPFGEVKKNLTRIPLIGNGDVRSPEDAKRMIDIAGVDGVIIGRAALANPWMIRQTVHYLETGELLP